VKSGMVMVAIEIESSLYQTYVCMLTYCFVI